MPRNIALSIAGSDSCAGAGAQADLLTFAAMGCYGTTALTSITAQNPDSISAVQALDSKLILEQIESIFNYYDVKAVKTGLLCNPDIIHAVSVFINKKEGIHLVVDPVMTSTSGTQFTKEDSVSAYKEKLFPISSLITPNLDEAEVLVGRSIESEDDMLKAAAELSTHYKTAILLKGGHLKGDTVSDIFTTPDGEPQTLRSARVKDINSHGSGCTLSAAITAALADGHALINAVRTGSCFYQKMFQ